MTTTRCECDDVNCARAGRAKNTHHSLRVIDRSGDKRCLAPATHVAIKFGHAPGVKATMRVRMCADCAAYQKTLGVQTLRLCRFMFADDAEFSGYTDDTRWNGFLNVSVTPQVHEQVIQHLYGERTDDEALEYVAEMRAMTTDAAGLISYAYGYATVEVR